MTMFEEVTSLRIRSIHAPLEGIRNRMGVPVSFLMCRVILLTLTKV